MTHIIFNINNIKIDDNIVEINQCFRFRWYFPFVIIWYIIFTSDLINGTKWKFRLDAMEKEEKREKDQQESLYHLVLDPGQNVLSRIRTEWNFPTNKIELLLELEWNKRRRKICSNLLKRQEIKKKEGRRMKSVTT